MTQEFHLSITALGNDRYLVRTETIAPGVPLAEEQMVWPVDQWLEQATHQAPDSLLSLLQGDGDWSDPGLAGLGLGDLAADAESPSPSQGQTLGQTLYNALFQGRIRDSWLAAQGVAQNRQQILRFRLGIKDSRLQRLPWEMLYGDDRPLAAGSDIVFTRYYAAATPGAVDLRALTPLPADEQPLRVLMVVSAPDDQERLALCREVQKLKDELSREKLAGWPREAASPVKEGMASKREPTPRDIQLTLLEQPGRSELVQALEQGHYHVLHYAGHSDVSQTGGELYLVSQQTGLTEWLSGEDLAGLLVNNGVWLAIFNSCRGAHTGANDEDMDWRAQNLVQALISRGIPGVIAMAERVLDDVAIDFTCLLYRNLKRGYPIDLSLSRTRQGLISAYGSDQHFWILPILYLHPNFDGYLQADHTAPLLGNLNPWLLGATNETESWLDESTLLPLEFPMLLDGVLPSSPGEDDGTQFGKLDDFTDLAELFVGMDDESDPSYEEDAAVVTNLIQQLTTPTTPSPAQEVPLPVPPGENLLPVWDTPRPILEDRLGDHPPAAPAPASQAGLSQAAPPYLQPAPPWEYGPGSAPRKPTQNWVPFLGWLPWMGLGIIGTLMAVGIAMTLVTREGDFSEDPAPPTTETPHQPEEGATDALGDLQIAASQAIAVGDNELARQWLEELLEKGDLEGVASALNQASSAHLDASADLLYIRGRLAWQQVAQGPSDAGVEDARRAWQQAVDLNPNSPPAWIALGFAHYALEAEVLEKNHQAIAAWETAIDLDKQQIRDQDDQNPQVAANPMTLHAYAGLAMAYWQLSQAELDPTEQQRLTDRAQAYFLLVKEAEPGLLDPSQSDFSWLWLQPLLNDWKMTQDDLILASP